MKNKKKILQLIKEEALKLEQKYSIPLDIDWEDVLADDDETYDVSVELAYNCIKRKEGLLPSKKEDNLMVIMLIVMLLVGGFGLLQQLGITKIQRLQNSTNEKLISINENLEILQRLSMYDEENENLTKTNGVHFRGDYYFCTWTGERSEWNINRTYYHESCHALVAEDYYHFCEEYYGGGE